MATTTEESMRFPIFSATLFSFTELFPIIASGNKLLETSAIGLYVSRVLMNEIRRLSPMYTFPILKN